MRSLNFEIDAYNRLTDPDGFLTNPGLMASAALCLVGGVYAGIHLALWNYTFPSRLESILWKIAGCALSAPTAIMALIILCGAGLSAIKAAFDILDTRWLRYYPDSTQTPSKFVRNIYIMVF